MFFRTASVGLLVSASLALIGCSAGESLIEPSDSAPMPEATPSATSSAVTTEILDGSCDALVDPQTVEAIFGGPATPVMWSPGPDPSQLGGLWCGWGGEGTTELQVAAFPLAVVPGPMREDRTAQACDDFSVCESWRVQGEIWLYATGPGVQEMATAMDAAAASVATVAPTVPASTDRWTIPACPELKAVLDTALARSDFGDFSGDFFPSGGYWDVLVANGVASWCGWHGEGAGDYADQAEVYLSPGATGASSALMQGWEPVSVTGASYAAYLAETPPASSRLVATDGRNTLEVTGRFLDREQLVVLAEAILGFVPTY